MEIISGLEKLPDPRLRRPIMACGVFDGVHLGHRRVIGDVLSWARREGAPAVVVTFDRHPREVVAGEVVPLIAPLEERLRRLGEAGADFCVLIPFTKEFSRLTAVEFIREVLIRRLGAHGVVFGHDARFGRDRAADLELLGREAGLEIRRSAAETFRGRPVSSSLIREAVAGGRLEEAAAMLGRAPSVIGEVVRGGRRGTQIGFPTANLGLAGRVHPPAGVYAAEALLEGRGYRAAAVLGTGPTFHEGGEMKLEAHLLDYAGGDLYGRVLEVRFLERIRDERKFESLEALRRQIGADVASVRAGGGA